MLATYGVLVSGVLSLQASLHQDYLLAAQLVLTASILDSLDGTLARVRQQQRPRYGFYVDHMVDSFGARHNLPNEVIVALNGMIALDVRLSCPSGLIAVTVIE